MTFSEHAIAFDCAGERLIGIVCAPAAGAAATRSAVLIVVGGPQYRAGSHRQFVQLARMLAGEGHAVLRFDYRGMGDSTGTQRSFEQISEDLGAAIDALPRWAPAAARLTLFGLCDGASAALLYLDGKRDARVTDLCLLNPWVRSDASLARTHLKHYYLARFKEAGFWRKLVGGGIGLGTMKQLANVWRASREPPAASMDTGNGDTQNRLPYQRVMARAWRQFRGRILLVLSGDDLTAMEFLDHIGQSSDWRNALNQQGVAKVTLHDADHTLSSAGSQQRFHAVTAAWQAACMAPATR